MVKHQKEIIVAIVIQDVKCLLANKSCDRSVLEVIISEADVQTTVGCG